MPWSRPGTATGGAGEGEGLQVVTRLSCTFKAISYSHHSVFTSKFSFHYKLYSQLLHIHVNPKSQLTWTSNNILTQEGHVIDLSLPSWVRRAIRAFRAH